jgi:hypothetical protein
MKALRFNHRARLTNPDAPMLEVIELADDEDASADGIRAILDGPFTVAFTVGGEAKDTYVSGYVDENGLLKNPIEWSIMCDNSLRPDAQPLAGSMVILGVDILGTGNSRGLTDDEIRRFSIRADDSGLLAGLLGGMMTGAGQVLPVLTYDKPEWVRKSEELEALDAAIEAADENSDPKSM